MPEIWVADASPVIVLAKAGYLDLLTQLADEVLLPEAVVAELLAGPETDPARRAVENGWGTRTSGSGFPVTVLEWGLGDGETAVIALALERRDCTVILDDADGRMCARTLGVPVIGTLGIVLRAKRQGHVASAAEILRALRAAGLFLDDALIRAALLRSTGEQWNP